MVNEWFLTRRGLANGVLFAATGMNGIILPFVIEVLLQKYGYRITLRATAVALVVLIGPIIPMIKRTAATSS